MRGSIIRSRAATEIRSMIALSVTAVQRHIDPVSLQGQEVFVDAIGQLPGQLDGTQVSRHATSRTWVATNCVAPRS
jgi:hypothetical protein